MDLDTKWTKFKYSNFNKCLCVLFACLMLTQAVLSAIPAINYVMIFGREVFKTETKTVYDYNDLWDEIDSNIDEMFEEANYNFDREALYEYKDKVINDAVDQYLKESDEKGYTYKNAIREYGDFENNGDYHYIGANNLIYFDSYFNYEVSDGSSKYVFFEEKYFGEDEISVRRDFENQFWRNYGNVYGDETNPFTAEAVDIKNIKYYVEHKDGTIVTNVEDKDSIISNVDEIDYIILENNTVKYSENLEDRRFRCLDNKKTKNIVCAYISIDTTFKETDKFSVRYNNYLSVKDIDFDECIVETAIFALLTLLFMLFSIRLAGRKSNNRIETSWIDKLPNDIHLILSVALAGLSGWRFFVLALEENPYSFYGENLLKWTNIVLVALALATYLVVLEYLTSLARKIKSNENIFKNTFIYKFTKAFVKFSKKVWAKIKVSSKKLETYFEALSFMPKELNKKAIIYSILIILLNVFLSLIGCAFIFATDDVIIVMGLVVLLGLFIIDGYIINKVANYLKYLDMIITASKTGNALNVDVNLLPNSLKTLAEGLEKTNAELDIAIRKAVKDERTKTELITNVSHDLKTPLTSVINYIDLLKKCDIKDETAKKYMDVIDEKSIKLKRLIEDLIEASKVTTGNVTLNKTMINLYELAMQAVVEETSDIEKAGLSIIFEESSDEHIVFADGTKVYRVFENLLSNARKYSAPYSRIYAKVYSDDKYGYFEIKNVSKEALNITADELTERFVRGDKSRNQDGNGLGLSIAKELCRLNGGELIITIDGDLFKATVKLPKTKHN